MARKQSGTEPGTTFTRVTSLRLRKRLEVVRLVRRFRSRPEPVPLRRLPLLVRSAVLSHWLAVLVVPRTVRTFPRLVVRHLSLVVLVVPRIRRLPARTERTPLSLAVSAVLGLLVPQLVTVETLS